MKLERGTSKKPHAELKFSASTLQSSPSSLKNEIESRSSSQKGSFPY